MEKTGNPWSVPVTVEDIPDTGLHLEIEAPAATRAAVAELAGVNEILHLSAVFDLTRQGSGVAISGQVSARVGQTCVVSLEPVESEVAEAIDVTFAPVAGAGATPKPAVGRKRTKRTKNGDEPPEPLIGGQVDLGALAIEFLILGIDPYPRKAGAIFAAPKVEDAGEHPFAALEALKKRLGGQS